MTGVRAGVIGVGSMGKNHARVYGELPGVDLVGVADADTEQAHRVAQEFDTAALEMEGLLDRVDLATIAVPTRFHAEVTRRCIEAGVDVLVEKPFVNSIGEGRKLASLAESMGVTIQVGHIERFNPAVAALFDIVDDLNVIAVEAHRLGPPLDRGMRDSVVLDLMIHDIDILLALNDSEVATVRSLGTPDCQYATAQVAFEDGLIGSLTASRRTQNKVRTLEVTAEDCYVTVDYIDQSIRINRHSRPEYTSDDSKLRYRDERVIEQPLISSAEPLKLELSSFVEAATSGIQPEVTVDDALKAIDVARNVDEQVANDVLEATPR